MDSKIQEFCTITGAGADLAKSLLAACNNSLEMAVNMHMEGVQMDQPSSSSNVTSQPGPSRISQPTNDECDDDNDEVRAPIPQKTEQLVGVGYEGYSIKTSNPHKNRIKTVFDGFRNFKTEQSEDVEPYVSKSKKRTLEELFKPPMDLIFKGDWLRAREKAEQCKKWLMVNIQDAGEFQCQLLNRDIWSNEAVRSILREHFLFWQQYKESESAQRFMTFYPIHEWPHVSVIDPRTGEQLITWNRIPDSHTFCELVTEFLSIHPSLDDMKSSLEPEAKKFKKSILDADEDDQIAAAIRASLAETNSEHNASSESESEIELLSGEDSNMSLPTPVKKRSKTNSPERNSESNSTQSNGNDSASGSVNPEDWKLHLGPEVDEKCNILIRFPDGNRESKSLACTSKLKALLLYVVAQGYSFEKYEIVTNFPRRVLTDLDHSKTLKELKLYPRETVFVQSKL